MIEDAKKDAPVSKDLEGRISFMVHDFFTPQPVHGADVYVFRWIFHNWSDKYCVRILRNLVPALKHGAKVVINDVVLPKPGELSNWHESRIRYVGAFSPCLTPILKYVHGIICLLT